MRLQEKIKVAAEFAAMIHKDQGKTYGDLPYSAHLDAVVAQLLRFDFTDKNLIAAAYLHDIVEDCGISLNTIFELFGEETAALVGAVTDEPGANRKERKAKTYPKIKATPGALALKLADRLANVEHALEAGNIRMFKMYQKEQAGFVEALRTPGELDTMWLALDSLFKPIPPKPIISKDRSEI